MNNHNLAYNLRPKTIEDVIGQQHLLGPGKIIKRMVDAKTLTSMILYGPPGIGKTSIASALSGSTGIPFEYFNASVDDKKKLQSFAKLVDTNKEPIIILLDEIHRLDKPKQDFLLPFMESGDMIIIGATTENPYINVNPAIRSRSQIFELKPIQAKDLILLINRAIADKENGLGNYNINIDEQTKNFLASNTNGDARSVLSALELAVKSTAENNGVIEITLDIVEECLQRKAIDGDKNGDAHYNTISALQKSIRGSDANASLHYLARILESGDLTIAVRRLMVIAFEDIGLTDPTVAPYVLAATNAALQLGLPEARIPLANAVTMMALSPKSNAPYKALDLASMDLSNNYDLSIPNHLKDTHYKGSAKLGHVGYLYPHDYQNALIKQQYLPDSLKGKEYLSLTSNGSEQKYKNIYNNLNQLHLFD